MNLIPDSCIKYLNSLKLLLKFWVTLKLCFPGKSFDYSNTRPGETYTGEISDSLKTALEMDEIVDRLVICKKKFHLRCASSVPLPSVVH